MLIDTCKRINDVHSLEDLSCIESVGLFEEFYEPDMVYHYTSPEGLLGILGITKNDATPCLRFTRADYVNDASEGSYILDIYGKVLYELYENHDVNEEFYNTFRDIEIAHTALFEKSSGSFKQANSHVYICCFSVSNDSLPMWNYYTKNGKYEGYSIGVSIGDFQELEKLGSAGNRYVPFYKIIYDKVAQEKTIGTLLTKVQSLLINGSVLSAFAKSIIARLISGWSLFYKSEYFEHEKEVRAVIHIPSEAPVIESKDKDSTKNNYKVKYRENQGLIIPYIEYPVDKAVFYDITVAPGIKDESATSSIVHLIKSNGFVNSDVQRSKIPVRF